MKKGLFTILNYMCPQELGILSMHCSCTEGVEKGDTTLLFGLSGTGKTTLSADPKRLMLGDDEHVWTDKGVFNVEGGCYAKVINLDSETEPDVYRALQWGCILENVIYDEDSREVDYFDGSITENTRASYALEAIPYAKIPAIGEHPKNIIFLTCDAAGVLPPVSKLTPAQAQYHFINGYTSKLAGTEVGIKDPQRTFSACFGEAFIVLHPMRYAAMLSELIEKHGSDVWLVNTGWVGGKYGVGNRMDLPSTRKILDAIHDGSLAKAKFTNFKYFDVAMPDKVNGVDTKILDPENGWTDKKEFDEALKRLVDAFRNNHKKYEAGCEKATNDAGPKY
jgi:phosphoenolpyruvate carboxykinase (ATP)